MPNLIGTAPDQVPVNGLLGNMAFQNKEGVIVDLLSTTALTVTGAASFAGTIANSLGSAAAPSYTFTGDLNTGMWSPAADTLAFSEGGVEAMRITSAGNVGIGTASPNASALLDVTSTTSGFLPPRMTTTQRDAISTPADGLVIYNTTIGALEVRQAGQWVNPSTAGIVNTPASMETDFYNQYYTSRRSAQTFDQLLDFTRTTSGTFVGSNGLIQNTPASRNLLTQTQQFDNAAWSKTAATVTANSAVAPDGTSTADTLTPTATTSVHGITSTSVGAQPANIVGSVYFKAGTHNFVQMFFGGSATPYANFNLSAGTSSAFGAGTTASITSVGNGWFRCEVFSNIASLSSLQFALVTSLSAARAESWAATGTETVFLWGAQLEAASAATTYTRNNGGVFPPRFDYDPVTLAPKGLLIEEQRTNLFTYSEQFDNGLWVKDASTITTNATTAPDGTSTADKLIPNSGTSGYVYRNAQVTSGSAAFSIFVKAAEWGFVRILFGGSYSPSSATYIRLSDGVVTSGSGFTAQNYGNGWFRITGTSTYSTASDNTIYVIPTNSGTSETTGNGTSGIFLWGGQMENAAFATSYIPTVASQVTRSADNTSIVAPNFSSWYNQSAGSFVVEVTTQLSNAQNQIVATISDGTTTNRASIFKSATGFAGFRVTSGGTNAHPTAPNVALTGNLTHKVALALSAGAGNVNCAVDGVLGVANSTSSMPSGVNSIRFGLSEGGNSDWLNGHIRSIRYYPTRLTNTQLQALTA